MGSLLRRRMLSPGKLVLTCADWKDHHAQRRVSGRHGHEEGPSPQSACRAAAQRNRVDLLAQEYVLAEANRSALCVRCAGLSPARWRSRSAGVRRHPGGNSRAAIAFWGPRQMSPSRRRPSTLKLMQQCSCHGRPSDASTRFAKHWMRPHDRPARAGAKIRSCWKR